MELRKLNCLRCGAEMTFRERTHLELSDNSWWNYESLMKVEIYACPQCGKLEFFLPVKPKKDEDDSIDATGYYIPGVAEDVKCYQCGREHPADDPFCPLCGMPTRKPEAKRCEWCGEELAGGEVRCPHCGAGLRTE